MLNSYIYTCLLETDIKNDLSKYFQVSNIAFSIIRTVLWGILKALQAICDFSADLIDKSYEILLFSENQSIQTFLTEWKDVLYLFTAISIVLLGLIYCCSSI